MCSGQLRKKTKEMCMFLSQTHEHGGANRFSLLFARSEIKIVFLLFRFFRITTNNNFSLCFASFLFKFFSSLNFAL